MTNRSDRRALTLILPKVFSETVDLIRRARANFHRGPEEQFFHEEAESMTATIVLNPGKNLLHFSGGTIYDNNSCPEKVRSISSSTGFWVDDANVRSSARS